MITAGIRPDDALPSGRIRLSRRLVRAWLNENIAADLGALAADMQPDQVVALDVPGGSAQPALGVAAARIKKSAVDYARGAYDDESFDLVRVPLADGLRAAQATLEDGSRHPTSRPAVGLTTLQTKVGLPS